MSPIVNDSPIKFTCAVCGSLINPIAKGMPDFSSEFSNKCSKCNESVCKEHFDEKSKCCTNCKSKGADWCGTPGLF